VRRYAPAEVAATAGALLGALVGAALAGPIGAAVGGDLGEGLAFYGLVVARELLAERSASRPRSLRRLLVDLVAEFGPAEALDSLALRPLAMYAGPYVTGDLLTGTVLGKVAADLVFYAVAAVGYERRRVRPPDGDPLAPAALDTVPHATPYLLMDLDRVVHAYRCLAATLPVDAIHYATKCNSEPHVLAALHRAGCGFEVASYPELALLRRIGVRPVDVLFSNPVKPPEHVARAHRAGCRRFAVDSVDELDKIAEHAPGADVYVRLRRRPGASSVPSEGKFGVRPGEAGDLLLAAVERGLRAYGVAFHVGSQMTSPQAWAEAIDEVGALAAGLATQGIHLEMLDIGGGFPARYSDDVPPLAEYAGEIGRALDRLPYRMHVVAEPGRALVAEAGVLVGTVLGRARRDDREWVHLDVGAFNGVLEALETGNRLRYPLSDSRRGPSGRCHLTGPTCDSQDTILFDTALSVDLTGGDRVYIGSAGAYTTAYASGFNGFSVPTVHCTGPTRRAPIQPPDDDRIGLPEDRDVPVAEPSG
jgi:ornithine decarboxylase